jgi:hypothetical protein
MILILIVVLKQEIIGILINFIFLLFLLATSRETDADRDEETAADNRSQQSEANNVEMERDPVADITLGN